MPLREWTTVFQTAFLLPSVSNERLTIPLMKQVYICSVSLCWEALNSCVFSSRYVGMFYQIIFGWVIWGFWVTRSWIGPAQSGVLPLHGGLESAYYRVICCMYVVFRLGHHSFTYLSCVGCLQTKILIRGPSDVVGRWCRIVLLASLVGSLTEHCGLRKHLYEMKLMADLFYSL